MAKEELERRATAEKQAHEQALERVRPELSAAQAVAHETEQRLQALIAKQERTPRIQQWPAEVTADSPAAEMPPLPRRRGRPPKVRQPEPEASDPESDIVEWWKPGWRDRYR